MPIPSEHEPAVDVAITDIVIAGEFVAGRIISTRFFRDKRLLLSAHRGPFKMGRELISAETNVSWKSRVLGKGFSSTRVYTILPNRNSFSPK